MKFRCLIDNLSQHNEPDRFGNPEAVVNLRAQAGMEYESPYDLCEMFNVEGEMPLFEKLPDAPQPQLRRGGYVSTPVRPRAEYTSAQQESKPRGRPKKEE